jgi:hypothetical protein
MGIGSFFVILRNIDLREHEEINFPYKYITAHACLDVCTGVEPGLVR